MKSFFLYKPERAITLGFCGIFILLSTFITKLKAQDRPVFSGKASISIITCGEGPLLFEAFGHSAIRIQDPAQGLDLVFNYGVFNFNQENFYLNFAKGYMRYMLGVNSMEEFIFQYRNYKRSVREQVLNLDSLEVSRIGAYLNENLKPENREYYYDYFYNNCSTKIIELLDSALLKNVIWQEPQVEGKITFRKMIHQYTVFQPWGRLGIDLGLGQIIDQEIPGKRLDFLPDGVEKQLNRAQIRRGLFTFPFVKETKVLYQSEAAFGDSQFWFHPAFLFSIILLLSIFFWWKSYTKPTFQRVWAGLILILVGLLGLVELLIWLFTNHKAAAWNYNIFWANPLFLLVGLLIIISSLQFYKLRKAVSFYLASVLVFWFLFPQVLNVNLLPLVAALWVNFQVKERRIVNNLKEEKKV
jgi:hypothetical protein